MKRWVSGRAVQLLMVVGVCGVVGVGLLLTSHAATPTASFEAESGNKTSNAQAVTDSSASGGSAVRFSSGGGSVPAACANGGSYLWSNLETCGWPGPTNTGPVLSDCPGGQLTVNSGSTTRTINVTTNGANYSCQNITGCLHIYARNVTVKDVQIQCSSGKTGTDANGTAVITVDEGADATITNTTINGMDGVHACIWHQGTPATTGATALTVQAVNCYGINDGIFSWADTGYSQTTGDNFVIKDSYFHDFTAATANGHIDGYQTEGAKNGLIQHNTYLMTSDDDNSSDSAIAIWDSLKTSDNITVDNNLIAGGGFAIYAEDYSPSESSPSGGYSVTNITFSNNKFSQHLFGCIGYYGVWYPRGNPTDAWHRSGNTVLETGVNVDNSNPTYQGSSCT